MIVSHKYKFVFMKTKKTGGSSVELALSKFLEPGDYATMLAAEEEKLRGPAFKDIVAATTARFSHTDYALQNNPGFPHHGMRAIQGVLGDEIAGYRKFTVERNPWDKLVSGYFFHRKNRARIEGTEITYGQDDFLEQIRKGQMGKFHEFHLYMFKGETLVDDVIQYAGMDEGINNVLQDIGAPSIDLTTFSAKSGIRPQSKSDVYNELFGGEKGQEAITYVEKLFHREIAAFAYERPF